MDLSPTTTVISPVRDKTWLGSQHGTDATQTITLNLAGGTFAAVQVAGAAGSNELVIPSGVGLNLNGAGTYDAVVAADVAEGHLFEDVVFKTGSPRAGGALYWHGVVIQAKVPGTFVTGNRAPQIKYV